MRIRRHNSGVTLRCTDHEFEILKASMEKLDYTGLNTGQRRSFSRRTSHGEFLRIDRDSRQDD